MERSTWTTAESHQAEFAGGVSGFHPTSDMKIFRNGSRVRDKLESVHECTTSWKACMGVQLSEDLPGSIAGTFVIRCRNQPVCFFVLWTWRKPPQ